MTKVRLVADELYPYYTVEDPKETGFGGEVVSIPAQLAARIRRLDIEVNDIYNALSKYTAIR